MVINPSAMDTTPITDAQFVLRSAEVNNGETNRARYVLKNSQSPVVRAYAQRMLDDHTTANVELLSAVRTSPGGFVIPQVSAGRAGNEDMRDLAGLTGAALDKAYLMGELSSQKRSVNLFQRESDKGVDSSLRTYATRTLPAVKMHLQMSLAYMASNGVSTAVDAGGINLGGTGAGVNTPATSPNGTVGNNPATTSKGTTNGTEAGTGTVNNQGNPGGNSNGAPGLTAPTPLAGPTANPQPGATGTPAASPTHTP